MMNYNLKTCPFCGGQAKFAEDMRVDPALGVIKSFHIHCMSCKARTDEFSNEGAAIAHWEMRVGQGM